MHTGATHHRTVSTLVVAAALVATLSSCGSDSDADTDTAPPGTASIDTASAADTSIPDPLPADTGVPGTSASDGVPLVAFTAEEICERLTPDVVGAALSLEVTSAEPGVMDTPQCSYSYDSDGVSSNVTIASMRPEDVGNLPATEAFDYVLEINRQVAGDTEVEEVSLDVGDGAVRLSGPSLHLGVLRVGDRVVTVIVPAADADGSGVDELITQMATSLS